MEVWQPLEIKISCVFSLKSYLLFLTKSCIFCAAQDSDFLVVIWALKCLIIAIFALVFKLLQLCPLKTVFHLLLQYCPGILLKKKIHIYISLWSQTCSYRSFFFFLSGKSCSENSESWCSRVCFPICKAENRVCLCVRMGRVNRQSDCNLHNREILVPN